MTRLLPAFLLLSLALPGPALAADILDEAAATGRFDRFLDVVERAGLRDELSAGGPWTIFMPTDAAFDRLPPATAESFTGAAPGALREIVLHHVVAGLSLPSDEVPKSLRTANGGVLRVTWEQDDLTLFSDPRPVAGESARVVWGDVIGDNGRVHAVDAVMLPMAALNVDPPAPSVAVPETEPAVDAPVGAQIADRPEVETGEPEVAVGGSRPDASPQPVETEVTLVDPEVTAPVPAEPVRPAPTELETDVTVIGPGEAPEPAVTRTEPEVQTYVAAPVAQDAAPAQAQQAESEYLTEMPAANGNEQGSAAEDEAAASGPTGFTADDITDMEIVSRNEEARGSVEHVVLSPETGEIETVLARFGGWFGFFGKLVAIPWTAVEVGRGRPVLIADLSAQEIEQAEEVEAQDYAVAQ